MMLRCETTSYIGQCGLKLSEKGVKKKEANLEGAETWQENDKAKSLIIPNLSVKLTISTIFFLVTVLRNR
jgi:hypothetical protein